MTCQDGRQKQLFVAVRRIKLKSGAVDEYVRRVEAGAIPQMREMDGFRSFQVMKEDDGTVISFSIFDTQAMAEQSTVLLLPWIKENLAPLLDQMPEAIDGELIVNEVYRATIDSNC